jgi:hypothetical protein
MHPVKGLENYANLIRILTDAKGVTAIKGAHMAGICDDVRDVMLLPGASGIHGTCLLGGASGPDFGRHLVDQLLKQTCEDRHLYRTRFPTPLFTCF